MRWTWFHRLGSPPYVYGLARPAHALAQLARGAASPHGALGGLVLAPPGYQQDGFRIGMSTPQRMDVAHGVYDHGSGGGGGADLAHGWRTRWQPVIAPIRGLLHLPAALVTGALWGQPMWGTYWRWDPRLTSG
jgi:heme exporter protein C